MLTNDRKQTINNLLIAFNNNISIQFVFYNHQGLLGIATNRELSMGLNVKYINRYTDDVELELTKFVEGNCK